MALEIFRLVGSIFVDNDAANKSLQDTDKKAEGVGSKLLGAVGAAGKFAMGVGAAAVAVGGAMAAVAENTREYRTEQGKLQAAFEVSNFSAETARSTYSALNGVLGDSGQAVEAANHLAKLCDTEEELAEWTDICTGVYATFGDSLPIEGLTEAANETAKTGALTGSLADALNWAGVNEDAFQASLDACTTEQERQALITDTLNGLYSEAADAYREVNGEVINANVAQDNLNNAMASIGAAIEPFVTAGKQLLAEVLTALVPVMTNLAQVVIPWVTSAISTVSGWVDTLKTRLSESGITFSGVMTTVQTLFQGAMAFIQGVWTTIGQPVWNFIQQAVGLVASYFQEKMPAIKEFVRQAFADIQKFWTNNLKPAFEAIGNFINNVLAPAFKLVFNHIIVPVVETAFQFIKNLWNNTLKPVFTGITDFISGVFTLNFSQAFSGLVKVVGGIWNGIVSAVKNPINLVIGIINSFIRGLNKIKVPSWVPAIGGKGINIPAIPMLEEGAVLERGQTGFLEGNGAEAVVPLHQNKKWTKAVAEDMDAALGGNGSLVAVILEEIRDLIAELLELGIYLDGDKLVGALAKRMDKKLGQIQAQKARA